MTEAELGWLYLYGQFVVASFCLYMAVIVWCAAFDSDAGFMGEKLAQSVLLVGLVASVFWPLSIIAVVFMALAKILQWFVNILVRRKMARAKIAEKKAQA